MKEFLILIGQILIITCIQSITEMFIDSKERPYIVKLVSVACFTGCLYLLIQFVFVFVLKEILSVVEFPFWKWYTKSKNKGNYVLYD